jgi:hypothetical protein
LFVRLLLIRQPDNTMASTIARFARFAHSRNWPNSRYPTGLYAIPSLDSVRAGRNF